MEKARLAVAQELHHHGCICILWSRLETFPQAVNMATHHLQEDHVPLKLPSLCQSVCETGKNEVYQVKEGIVVVLLAHAYKKN